MGIKTNEFGDEKKKMKKLKRMKQMSWFELISQSLIKHHMFRYWLCAGAPRISNNTQHIRQTWTMNICCGHWVSAHSSSSKLTLTRAIVLSAVCTFNRDTCKDVCSPETLSSIALRNQNAIWTILYLNLDLVWIVCSYLSSLRELKSLSWPLFVDAVVTLLFEKSSIFTKWIIQTTKGSNNNF